MTRRLALVAALAAPLAWIGCAGARPPSASSPVAGRQALYRIQFEGADGNANFRLLLRRATDQRFDLAASDPLGRTLWALQVVEGEGTWFDFRERRVCEIGRRFRLDALRLPELPLEALPRILAAEPPHAEGQDADGRTWSLKRRADGSLLGWETSNAAAETLRCELDAGGASGTLRSDSSRLRFRRVADEPLAAPIPLRQPLPDFTRGDCQAVALS